MHGAAQVPAAAPHNRVQGKIVDADAVTLLGNTHPLAIADFDRGLIASDARLERMVLVLQPDAAQQKALDALTAAQQQPNSPLYHQWLSPEEYGRRFGVSEGDLAAIISWLKGHGFQVEPVPAGRRLVLFSGTAAQMADTFHTSIHQYSVKGQLHLANAEDPQIPRSLAPVVAGVLSLHDFRRTSATHSIKAAAHPEYSQGSTHYLLPADFATIYNLAPLDKVGFTGTGTSIAIVGRSNINLSDIATFRSFAGLSTSAPKIVLPNGDPGLIPGDQDEATLDVEWSGAVAPAATVQYVAARSTATTDGVDLSAQYIVNNKTAPVMSTSYGSCEAYMGSSELTFYNGLWQQAAAEGITAFVSSGDSGASGCNGGSSTGGSGLGVNGLCSSPYSTCVGGTQFNEGSAATTYWNTTNGSGGGSARSYIPEQVWNESASNGGQGLWSSGGGISLRFSQPAWQKGVPGAVGNGMRTVPDVSLTSASHDGYIVNLNGSFYVFAGTSASAPSFAGILARIVQAQAGKGQGNINPTLYGMLTASANPFHPTPGGNNSVPGVSGYTASGGVYNLATGLGSVDANLLRAAWPSGVVTPAFTLTAKPATLSLLPGAKSTFTVSVAASGGFTGKVALAAKAPYGVTVAFSPASIAPGATATATVAVAAGTAPTTAALMIPVSGTSGNVQGSTSVALNILAPATLSLATSASAATVVQGKNAAITVTTTTAGTYTGAVALAVTGLPSGVTAAFSANNLTLTGAGSKAVTLTLTAAPNAVAATSALQITATGGGLSAKSPLSLQVTAAPGIQLAFSPAQLIMKSTATQPFSGTVTLLGGLKPAFNSTGLTFQIAGVPAGIDSGWNASYTAGNPTIPATFTLYGSSSAASSQSTLTITARVTDGTTGQAYNATQTVTLSVTKATQIGKSSSH